MCNGKVVVECVMVSLLYDELVDFIVGYEMVIMVFEFLCDEVWF